MKVNSITVTGLERREEVVREYSRQLARIFFNKLSASNVENLIEKMKQQEDEKKIN
jgi:hypothetical protein